VDADCAPWLEGLTPAAAREGRYVLLCRMVCPREGEPSCVPVDRAAFQAWIIAYTGYYRTRGRPWDDDEAARVTALEEAVRWRRR
jgi:hypothetical protein